MSIMATSNSSVVHIPSDSDKSADNLILKKRFLEVNNKNINKICREILLNIIYKEIKENKYSFTN